MEELKLLWQDSVWPFDKWFTKGEAYTAKALLGLKNLRVEVFSYMPINDTEVYGIEEGIRKVYPLEVFFCKEKGRYYFTYLKGILREIEIPDG